MNLNKITLIEAIALVLIITINRLALNLPQTILMSYGSSSILNIIYVSIIAIIFTFIVIKLFKRFPNSDIVDVANYAGGKVLRNIIGIILIVYITLISSNLLRNASEVIQILYYSDTPIIFLLAFFVIVCIVANSFGLKTVSKSNVVFCSIMLIGLVLTFLSVAPTITFERAFPLLGYGTYQTFFVGLSNLSAFNGLLVLYLLPPMLSEKKDFKKIAIISIIVTSILIFLATASLLLSFVFSSQIDQISSLYLLLSNTEFGKYLQHPKSIFVFTWILSFMTYLNVCCMFIVQFLKKLTSVKNGKPFVIPVSIVIFILALLPNSLMEVQEFGAFLYKYAVIPILYILFPIILFLANAKYKKSNKNNNPSSSTDRRIL